MDPEVASLMQQVDRLTATSRRQQRWLLVLSLVLAVLGCAAARGGQPDVIRARAFEAVDADGRVRALLSSESHSGEPTPALVLFDAKGDLFAMLTQGEDRRYQPARKCAVFSLSCDDGDESLFGVTTLSAFCDGGRLSMTQGEDEGHASFGIDRQSMGLRMIRNDEEPLVDLSALHDGGTLQIRNKDGESTFHAP